MKKLIVFFGLVMCASYIGFGQYSTTPIMLSLPMDGDTIEEDEPMFVWQTSMSNLESDPRLNMKLNVVQIDDEQTPTEAMLENNPVFTRQNLLSTSINYSEVDHELVENVWYAWQLVLYYNGVQVQQSEVFKFIKSGVEPAPISFYVLKTKADNSIIQISEDLIYFTTNEKGEFALDAKISGKRIPTQAIKFEELNSESSTMNQSHQVREARYFKCDLKDLDLKKGNYRIDWKANEHLYFITTIEKI